MARNTKKKTIRKDKKNKVAKNKDKNLFFVEIILFVVFLISIFMFLSLFNIGAAFGKYLKEIQLGLFGILGYIFPIVFFIAYLFFVANINNKTIKIKIILSIFIYILFVAFVEIFSGRKFTDMNIIIQAYKLENYGGLVGSLIVALLSKLFGKIVSAILIFALICINYLFIANISFSEIINIFSRASYNKINYNIDKIKNSRMIKIQDKVRVDDYSALDSTSNNTKILKGVSIINNPLDIEIRLKKYNEKKSTKIESSLNDELSENNIKNQSKKSKGGKNQKANIEYKGKNDGFSTPLESKIKKEEDIFSGIIINSNSALNSELTNESLDDNTIEKVSNILNKRKHAIEANINTDLKKESELQNNEAGKEEDIKETDSTDDIYLHEAIVKEIKKDKLENNDENLLNEERSITTSTGKLLNKPSINLNKDLYIKDIEKYEKPLIQKEKPQEENKIYILPPIDLLKASQNKIHISDDEYKKTAIKLQQTLHNFGVSVKVTNISCGPVVTRYELSPEQGVKVSKIVSLQDDIKLSLAASDIRIEAPIPGKSAVGIEVPNKEHNLVYFRELIDSNEFKNNNFKLSFALGKDISGQIVVTDIAKMPHLLIAGATGSGKSVCINTLIMSILYKYKPDEVKMIMVDPKVVELSIYNGIPHLLIPVVTEPKKAASAINWAVAEMTQRYKKFAKEAVRDLKAYNEKMCKLEKTQGIKLEKLPQIIIIIDELADLMMVAQNEVEEAICRLAQLARACGIHLVIATQRPSVNVITGLIKANIPSRIAFAVTSGVDSRTILDSVGADKLLGKGDMLFAPQGNSKPMRVQGAFIDDNEVQNVVEFIKNQQIKENYNFEMLEEIEKNLSNANIPSNVDVDELFMQAGRFIIDKEKASIGNLQRAFKIGFNRAARIMDQLCEAGVVGNEQGTKPREILMDIEAFEKTFGKE